MNKKWKASMAGIMIAGVLSGCAGGAGEAQTPGKKEQEVKAETLTPVTLNLFQHQIFFTQEDFELLFVEPLKKKYPHITITLGKETNIEKVVAAGQQIDLIAMWNGNIPSFKDLGLYEDMTPLAVKRQFDLKRFDQLSLDTMRSISDQGELYGVPFAQQFNALYYNKDVFEKFGVPYPQDGMTWDDAIELGKKVTRLDNGVQYRGLDPDHLTRILFPLGLNLVDLKTSRSLVTGDDYRKGFENGKAIYSIPGNKPANLKQSAITAFMKEKNVGMLASINIFNNLKQYPELNWDVAQFPSYKDKPNTFGMYDLHTIMISKSSQHKDDAMRVLEVLFSREVQLEMSKKTARLSMLQDPEYRKVFGQDIPYLQGKRIQSIFKSKSPASPAFSPYYSKSMDMARDVFIDYVNDKMDVNTALRSLDEKITQYVETEKKK
ncbi:ABC transporter substrate-binding protein [Paenibacillus allorhizosphaerae]|uniref:Extracellular solute-binding protein n=1 Tax=Paenibacillus allorhizosphaerae TaxID=2849866 RepID=A0ABM8VD96_9BACL|nr:extracellular solute-binding protein [Paenibacillus allorhizosphaerae]CAG7627021.1 hypothetical protein PAECIP111802_01310 [Paenibacillus allorhizosphaerae]